MSIQKKAWYMISLGMGVLMVTWGDFIINRNQMTGIDDNEKRLNQAQAC